MLATFTLGLLADAWTGWSTIAGVAFVAGSALAARHARRAALLTVAVSPPLLFFAVLAIVKAGTASGNVLVSATAGIAIALAGAAPWLFAGTALCLIIAWVRGLPRCVRDLRREVRRERTGRPAGPPGGRGRPLRERSPGSR